MTRRITTVGVLLGLLVTNQPFGIVMSGIGVIALAGIVVLAVGIAILFRIGLLDADGVSRSGRALTRQTDGVKPTILDDPLDDRPGRENRRSEGGGQGREGSRARPGRCRHACGSTRTGCGTGARSGTCAGTC